MKINLHKNARTTPSLRYLIQNETQLNVADLALKTGVSETTIRKWRKRSFVFDKPHTPKKIVTALTPFHELMAVLIRMSLRTGLDDLLQIVHTFITPDCSRSALNRCLNRYHISRLIPFQNDLSASLNDYRGTYFYHTKIVFPRLPGRSMPIAVQILLDCSFRWAQSEVTDLPQYPPLNFIKKGIQQFPLTVLGIIHTDPIILSEGEIPEMSRRHGQLIQNFCDIHDLDSYYSQTIPGKTLDRLRQTFADLLKHQPTFMADNFNPNGSDLKKSAWIYNTQLFQRTLKQKTPEQALKNYYTNFPGSFKKRLKQFHGTPSILESP